jgi:hypothetical protein
MHARYPKTALGQLCKLGLSCLLAVPFQCEAGPGQCREADRAEPVPELLALADWPLDDPSPAGDCGQEQQAAIDLLPVPVEIPPALPVVQVVAWERTEEPPPAAPEAAPEDSPSPQAFELAALDSGSLDNIRGGFEVADLNLKLSFGIERAVYINGELVTSTVLNIKDLQTASGGAGIPVVLPGNAGAALTVIQNGAGNNFSAQIGPNLAGTVIQNSLNDQRIVNTTTINATVNSAEILRSMNFLSNIRDGVIGSLRH